MSAHHEDEPPWPVDLPVVRLWPMEGEDGPLLQELFDDLGDFESAFGPRGHADAVATFLIIPEGHDYDDKLLVGLWRHGGLVGALDCIRRYPVPHSWTVGLFVVAQRHRGQGVGSDVVAWLEGVAAATGAKNLRFSLRTTNTDGLRFLRRRGYRPEEGPVPTDVVVVAKPLVS